MKRTIVILAAVILVLAAACPAGAETGFFLRASYGAGHPTLGEWKDFWDDVDDDGFYEQPTFGQYLGMEFGWSFSDHHAVVLSVEHIGVEPVFFSSLVLYDLSDIIGEASWAISWDISTIPIGLSYEFRPAVDLSCVRPFLGVGGALYLSEVAVEVHEVTNTGDWPIPSGKNTRDGTGWGLHAWIGAEADLSDAVFLHTRVRGRYADGLAFDDEDGDIKVEFTGVDFNLGIGVRF
ncbi:MAG: outer membrane beta-barrel protein [Candidatus Krumholzibacteriota bacterium]|nr:outer membrane beta-barrel protein [Candidatus Krumholzibacteriota bacterium]